MKNISIFRVVRALFVIWLVLFWYLLNPRLIPGDETTTDLQLNPSQIENDVRFLTSLSPNRSFSHLESMKKTEDFITARFKSLGFEVKSQDVAVDDGTIYHNLITRYGAAESKDLIIVGAHYDVAGDNNPGADDNASGVAGLLELARHLQTEKPLVATPIELVAYTLEEPPFFGSSEMGSAQHARSVKESGTKVRLMISLEMLGYFNDRLFSQKYPMGLLYAFYPWSGDFIGVIGRPVDRSLTKEFSRAMSANTHVPLRTINAPSFVHGVDFSDHRNYWENDWPALMITDTAFLRNEQYHKPGDTPDRLDYSRVAEVMRGVYAGLVKFAASESVDEAKR